MEGHDRRQPAVVLVACDEPGALVLLGRVVERAGWRAEPVPDVDTGIDRATERLPRCVVAHLPHAGVGSALELADRVRAHPDPRVASTVLVVVERLANREVLLAAGADVHLERPVHVREVVEAIEAGLSVRPAPSGDADVLDP